jgi:hypothetical protein
MMVMDGIDLEAYDTYQVEIGYYKLFPHIMKDFVTRKDAKQMMTPNNLIVNTDIAVTPGQAVSTTGSPTAQAGSTVSPGKGTGLGKVNPIYNGGFPHAESQTLKAEIKLKKEAGGVAVTSLTEPVKQATEG